jgi:hypothetical protein
MGAAIAEVEVVLEVSAAKQPDHRVVVQFSLPNPFGRYGAGLQFDDKPRGLDVGTMVPDRDFLPCIGKLSLPLDMPVGLRLVPRIAVFGLVRLMPREDRTAMSYQAPAAGGTRTSFIWNRRYPLVFLERPEHNLFYLVQRHRPL